MRYAVRLLPVAAFLALMLACSFSAQAASQQDPVQSLSGEWRFLMNGPKPGAHQEASPRLAFSDKIELPGTTDTRRKGEAHGPGWTGALTRVYKFEGPAWYQREISIPEAWRGKRVTLHLERTKYTQVWLDNKPLGENALICTPQEYVLENSAPGSHVLTLMVDNARRPVPGDMHQMSDNTQGNWNGVIGRIELRATDGVWLDDVQVYPDVAKRVARVKITLGNAGNQSGTGALTLVAKGKGVSAKPLTIPVSWTATGGHAEAELPLGTSAALWDEFTPALHTLTVQFVQNNRSGDAAARDERAVTFGLRDFATKGSQFAVNGKTTFLRGRHDACVFPLTGHPPMDVAGWLRYFRIVKSYGLNHVRFHTWTPPDAAFTAADQLGVYVQPELPFWGDFNEKIKAALKPEGEAILRRFGNHPSFVMFSMGNENRFSREVMGSLVSELRALDNRHLYAQGSNNFMWDPQLPAGDDYLTTARVKNSTQSPSRNVRGSHAGSDNADGNVQAGPPNTMKDYAGAIAGIPRPVLGHEVGQYTVYPNFREIEKYTGVMRPDNFSYFQKKLANAGMLDQANDFFHASGELSALCYREEIETALRTPGFGGFQLLDLQDFPGQGTALVGMLDAFMDSKGLITPDEWRQFCAPTVILARLPRYVWTSGERFSAQIDVANYGPSDKNGAVLKWTLRDANSESQAAPLASGELQAANIAQGGVRSLGELTAPLLVFKPTRLNLELEIAGSGIKTRYPLWVYPAGLSTAPPSGVTIVKTLDAAARQKLANGERVVLIADGQIPLAKTVGGGFTTDFWNFTMFHNKPGTMGLLCNPKTPALSGFPTEFRSNWQWFNLVVRSQPLILDALPRGYRPLVQVIDNDERVHRLGLVFELKAGPGRLLVCATDLLAMQNEPEARALLSSLLHYAGSERFNPQTELAPKQLVELFQTTLVIKGKETASSSAGGWQGLNPDKVVDGNDYTGWRVAENAAAGESWWQIAFDQPQDLNNLEVLWAENRAGYKYAVEGSNDNGATWRMLSDQTTNAFTQARHTVTVNAKSVQILRIRITGAPQGVPAELREIRFLRPE